MTDTPPPDMWSKMQALSTEIDAEAKPLYDAILDIIDNKTWGATTVALAQVMATHMLCARTGADIPIDTTWGFFNRSMSTTLGIMMEKYGIVPATSTCPDSVENVD